MVNDILEYIDMESTRSEIDVLISITESYQKALSIVSSEDYSDEIVQESFGIYMEDGEGSSVKMLFKRVVSFFKNVINKIKSIFSKIFNTNRKKYIQSYNILMIVGQLDKVLSSNIVTEYLNDEITDEVFQEALFDRKSEQEKEEEEYMKAQSAREKELETNVKKNDAAYKETVRALRKQVFSTSDLTKILSNKEIDNIVRITCMGVSKEELRKLRDAVNQISKYNNFEHIDEKIYDTLKTVIAWGEGVASCRHIERRSVKHTTAPESRLRDAENYLAHDNTEKTTMDVALIEKLADTMGSGFNMIAGREIFSAENLKALMYGPQKVITFGTMVAGFVGSSVLNILAKAAQALATFKPTQILDDLSYIGKQMDVLDAEFDNYYHDDINERKKYGVKLNKTMSVLKFVGLDNLKEETYRWTDDPFNSQSYGEGNGATFIAGGPISVVFTIVCVMVFHKPIEQFLPGAGSLGMMGFARILNPGRARL